MSGLVGNPFLLASAAGGATGYQIERSLRFNSSDSAFLSRTFPSAGNRRTFTFSFWIKRTILGTSNRRVFGINGSGGTDQFSVMFDSTNALYIYGNSTGTSIGLTSTGVFRDASAWYHIVLAVDTTQATAANRFKAYVNGSSVAGSYAYPSQNDQLFWNNADTHYIGRYASGYYTDDYLADIHFIDGQALTPSSFTEVSATTGQLIPKQYTGSFGTNGFWLKFSDNSAATATTLGKDYSGNSNNWTPNNLSVTAGAGNDSLVDTPTSYGTDTGVGGEVRGNYCTLNPLAKGAALTLSNGNLDVSDTGATSAPVGSTLSVDSGKWYYEVTLGTATAYVGISTPSAVNTSVAYLGAVSGQAMYNVAAPSSSWYDGSIYNYSTGAVATTGDIIGVALNCDTGVLTFYKNGVSRGAFGTNILSGRAWQPAFKSNDATSATFNFGQRPFAYTAPSGFKALCDTNLPTPVVAKPSTVMDVKLYTGNGSTQTISGLGFSPDLVWGKVRSTTGDHHIVDSVRGDASGTTNKTLFPNTTDFEYSSLNRLCDFSSTGFTAGGVMNTNAATYAAWCWDAGSSTVTNTQGSITSSVRANPSAGFSIVTWTPASRGTVGHGLNVAPEFIITKDRDTTNGWLTYHKSLGEQKYLSLNLTSAVTSNSTIFSTAPTSTVFDPGTGVTSGNGYGRQVCYCFAPVAGYSSFGSYTGNGATGWPNADGPFVYTGFRPRFILIKRTDASGNWLVLDAARLGYNASNNELQANLSAAEGTYNYCDILSNGFKLRGNDASGNASGSTYVWAAFAESPFQYARAR